MTKDTQPPANSYQPAGDHYKKHKIQHWDAVRHWSTREQYIGYLLNSASKYLARYNDKDGRNGVKKAIHYLQKLLETLDQFDQEDRLGVVGRPPIKEEGMEIQDGISIQSIPHPITLKVPDPKDVEAFLKVIAPAPANATSEPRSTNFYTYEGGNYEADFWRCKACRAHFATFIGTPPEKFHVCALNDNPISNLNPADPGANYVNQG